jgi:hypothetical protein
MEEASFVMNTREEKQNLADAKLLGIGDFSPEQGEAKAVGF